MTLQAGYGVKYGATWRGTGDKYNLLCNGFGTLLCVSCAKGEVMGVVGDFVKRAVDDMSSWWKDRLRGWMASWVSKGVMELFDAFEPDLRAEVKPMLLRMREIEGLPDDFKVIIDRAVEEKSAIQFAAILPYLIGIVIGLGMGAATPAARVGSYQLDKLIHSARFDPGTITRLWLRNPELYEKFWQDLRDQGWNEDRVNAAKELAFIMPPATDVITWAAREVFEPTLREKYQIDKDLPPDYLAWAEKVGITGEVAKNYWAAHWALPGSGEIAEMWRRGILTDKDVSDFWVELDMVPWVRDYLFEIFRAWPTRVDIRRFWDMGTIDEARLEELYKGHGYRGKDLEDYMLWTKVYTAFPDLMARYRNGWVTPEQVVNKLIGLGMTPERAQMFMETKMKAPVGEERVQAERDLTKSEIYAGVKKAVITWEEGLTMLQALGYDREEAEFILEIRVGAGASPESYLELMKWVQDWRKTAGLEAKEISEELLAKEKEYKAIIAEHEAAIKEGASQAKIDTLGEKRATIESQYRQMLKLSGL